MLCKVYTPIAYRCFNGPQVVAFVNVMYVIMHAENSKRGIINFLRYNQQPDKKKFKGSSKKTAT